jgi:hypothetical protein
MVIVGLLPVRLLRAPQIGEEMRTIRIMIFIDAFGKY